MTGPLGRSGPQVLCRGVGNDLLRPLSLSRGARFIGRTDPLSRGADYISSASYARRGQLVITEGELRRPTSTDGDATTAPVPRVPKSPFRLAASRLIRTCRTPGEGAPPPQRHARLSGRPRSFPVSPMARHSTSGHPPCRILQSRRPEQDRAEGCVWPAVTFPTNRGPTPPSEGPCEGGTPTVAEHSGFTKPAARARPCALLVCECASSPSPSSACVRVRAFVCVCARVR